MTVAKFTQTDFNTQTPSQYRAALDADIAVAAPIVDNFAPHAVSTPNMTVQLDAGAIPGVGVLPTQLSQQTSSTLTAPTTNPRKDIVYIDAITGVIGVATGTEAVSPADPAIPSGKIPIARLAMTVGMATVTNSIITDLRAPAMATSGSGSVVAINANTTITVGQSGTTFKLSGTSVTATLPTPVGNSGIKFRLFGSDTNTQTVSTPAATLNFPDGTTASGAGLTNNQEIEIQSDGAVWRVLGMAGWQVSQTPATADNSTKVATTAMVQAAIAAAGGSSIQGAYKNLQISASGASASILVSVDEISLENSSNAYVTLRGVSFTINSAASGANGLDTGTLAANTQYSIWAIYNGTTKAGVLTLPLATTGNTSSGSAVVTSIPSTAALSVGMTFFSPNFPAGSVIKSVDSSTQITATIPATGTATGGALTFVTPPTMPSGYTHKARVGWMTTDNTGNKYPLGFTQKGDTVQPLVNATSNMPNMPIMASGVAGNITTPTWVAVPIGGFVPPTARCIKVLMAVSLNGAIMIAPNNSYGAINNLSNPPYASVNPATYSGSVVEMLIESSNIYWANNTASSVLACAGWVDNL